ncbi:MAG: hypothetical protein ACYCX4_04680 [Bacillota bacterium]
MEFKTGGRVRIEQSDVANFVQEMAAEIEHLEKEKDALEFRVLELEEENAELKAGLKASEPAA